MNFGELDCPQGTGYSRYAENTIQILLRQVILNPSGHPELLVVSWPPSQKNARGVLEQLHCPLRELLRATLETLRLRGEHPVTLLGRNRKGDLELGGVVSVNSRGMSSWQPDKKRNTLTPERIEENTLSSPFQ